MHDLKKMLARFEEIVSPNFCNTLAKQVKLVQRSTSQLQGYEFAQALIVPNAFLELETLNSFCVRIKKINPECNLTASALTQRLNTLAAVEFMKACFVKSLNELIQKEFQKLPDLQNLKCFNRVLIEDSTMAELHEKLSPHYKGRGGAASKSAVKIDYTFDYLSEQLVNIDFCSGSKPDVKLANQIVSLLEKDDLILRDLGYYALKNIQDIESKEAYYITRFKSNLDIYESVGAEEPLDVAKFLDKRKQNGIIDTNLFLGKEKHPVRLVACLMTEAATSKRLRDANRISQRCGTKLSKRKRNLLKYSVFITNIPLETLSGESVMATYRARWRVELIFKDWKSTLKIHLFKGYRIERFHCLLYARLTMLVLLVSMSSCLMRYAFEMKRELSSYKFMKYMIADHAFANALIEGRIEQFLEMLLEDTVKRLCKDKRNRPSLRSNVNEGRNYYNNLENKEIDRIAA